MSSEFVMSSDVNPPKADSLTAKKDWVASFHLHEQKASKLSAESSRKLATTRAVPLEQSKELSRVSTSFSEGLIKWQLNVFDTIRRLRKRTCGLEDQVNVALKKHSRVEKISSSGTESAEVSLERVKKSVRSFETDLSVFKEHQRQDYDELALQEASLVESLSNLELRFDGWLSTPEGGAQPLLAPPRVVEQETTSSRGAPRCARSSVHEKLDATVKDKEISGIRDALDALSAEIEFAGGGTGGWMADDHKAFLSLAAKLKSMESGAFVRAVCEVVQCGHEDVVEHVNWWREYKPYKPFNLPI